MCRKTPRKQIKCITLTESEVPVISGKSACEQSCALSKTTFKKELFRSNVAIFAVCGKPFIKAGTQGMLYCICMIWHIPNHTSFSSQNGTFMDIFICDII